MSFESKVNYYNFQGNVPAQNKTCIDTCFKSYPHSSMAMMNDDKCNCYSRTNKEDSYDTTEFRFHPKKSFKPQRLPMWLAFSITFIILFILLLFAISIFTISSTKKGGNRSKSSPRK